jgi:hypothetical protein
MTIEIQEPELEALIRRRMDSGHFSTVEDVLLQALKAAPEPQAGDPQGTKRSLGEFLRDSPLWGSGLEIDRTNDYPTVIAF